MLNNSQRATLRQELLSDPLGIGYAELSHDEVASALNLRVRSVVRKISKRSLLRWGISNDRMSKVRATAENGQDFLKSIVYAALKSLDIAGETISVDTEFLALLQALIDGNILDASDKDALVLAATETVSRVDELCGEGAVADNQDVYVCRVEME